MDKDYFLKKYKHKSKYELRLILKNRDHYQSEAVEAALELYDLRKGEGSEQKIKERPRYSKDGEFSVPGPSFSGLTTAFALSLFVLSLSEILFYYSSERLFEDSVATWRIWIYVFAFLSNHIIYKLEYGESNVFLGRSLNDVILLVMMFVTKISYEFMLDSSYRPDIVLSGGQLFTGFFSIAILIFCFEACVAFLKFLLGLVRCQIF